MFAVGGKLLLGSGSWRLQACTVLAQKVGRPSRMLQKDNKYLMSCAQPKKSNSAEAVKVHLAR